MHISDTLQRWVRNGTLMDRVRLLFAAVGKELDPGIQLPAAVELSQKWLRLPGSERWQIPAQSVDEAELQKHMIDLDLHEAVAPNKKWYDTVVILGATMASMAIRLKAVKDNEVTCDKLIAVTGLRGINEQEKKAFELAGVPIEGKTERDAALLLFASRSLPSARVVSVIAAGNKPDGSRATTEETITELALDLKPGSSLLFVSHQPFGLRQSLTVLRALGAMAKRLEIDFCFGPVLPRPMSERAGTVLDESCRLLYELDKAGLS